MKRYSISTAVKTAFGVGALSLALVGCNGSDGQDGEIGQPGEISIDINSASAVQTKVEQAAYDEASKTLTFEFTLTNPNGVAVTGLETLKDPLRIAFGRMGTRSETFTPYTQGEGENAVEVTARADGEEQIWLSYRNTTKDTAPMTGTNNWRPTRDCPEGETCLSYLGQGKYQITAPNIIETNGLDYDYDANQIHGIYVITYGVGENKLKNVEAYYWDPLTEQSVSSPKRSLEMETCTNCHVGQDHIRHGNYGNTAEGCGFCHTDYTVYSGSGVDANGDAVEFTFDGSIKGLVHAVHTGITETDRRELAKFNKVIADAGKNPAFAYQFDGAALDSNGEPKSALNFPASTADCQQCHVSYETTADTLPQGVTTHALSWFADMDVKSCQTCHGNYHYGDRTDVVEDTTVLTGCVSCHNSHEGSTRGGAFRHFAGTGINSREAASQAGMLIETAYSNINWDSTSSVLSFTMNLSRDGQAITTDHIPLILNRSNQLVLAANVYVNAVDSQNPDAYLASRSTGTLNQNTDGSFSVTVDATSTSYTLPALADALNKGADLAITAGDIKVCFNNKSSDLKVLDNAANTTEEGICSGVLSSNLATTQFIKIDGTAGAERTSAANYESCRNCHNNDMVARHGATHYRNADLHTCAQCHEGGDYNSLIVRVHGTFGKAHGREDVQALVSSAQCSACHNDDDFALENARSTAMRWDKAVTSNGVITKPTTFSSPQAGVCASCHVSDSYDIGNGKDAAKAHIESMGGVVDTESYSEASLNGESCSTCHKADSVKQYHNLK
ncbi:hypothetical protein LZP69_03320 [Shewanella sp. AS1]|uniref:multiheme c-type cytochrome n=1 Tax=Shewanella sp. AS1 TaxID=2907626 RepID=UPI001F46F5A9|nr:hypothetical protein [Shewanella sp. AS1]MCE9678228.1 hypothetical protein [Shewanella sp. AS1]